MLLLMEAVLLCYVHLFTISNIQLQQVTHGKHQLTSDNVISKQSIKALVYFIIAT